MKGHSVNFFATREDLEQVLGAIEARVGIKYMLAGLHASREIPIYQSALEIPSLGMATADSSAACERYLVVPKQTNVAVRDVPQKAGGVRYAVDQLMNQDAITLCPAGRRDEGAIISGVAGTTSETRKALEIFRLYRNHIRQAFTKRQSFYLGAEAMRLKREGFRLTTSIRSPREYDLA